MKLSELYASHYHSSSMAIRVDEYPSKYIDLVDDPFV
jgi:hypothetical protein